MQRFDMQQRGNALGTVLLILMALVVSVAAGYTTYVWQHDKVDKLTAQVTSLRTQVESLKNNASTAPQGAVYTSSKGVKLTVYAPLPDATITSPLAVIGEVPGNWSFEASFPVLLKDHNGLVIAQGSAHVLGNWMTDHAVPFSAQLTYSAVTTGSGTLILQKDNPSGLPANEDSLVIPIRF